MSTDYEKYAPLKEHFNPFDLTEKQTTLFTEIQKQHEKEFKPLQAIETRKAPFVKKYETAEDVVRDLKDVKSDKSLTPELKEKKMARIWGSLSRGLRYDEQSMRDLCKYEPRAASLIPNDLWTPQLAMSLLADHAEVYDLLPKELQTHDAVIEAYRDSIMKDPHLKENQFHVIGEDKSHIFFTNLDAVAVLNINPACPREKFFSMEGLEAALGQVCSTGHVVKGGTLSFDFSGSKRVGVIPATEVYIGLAKQILTQDEINRAENKTLDENIDIVAKKGSQDAKYEQGIMPLLQKHDREDIIHAIEKEKEKDREKKQRHETFIKKTKFPYDKETPDAGSPKIRIIPIAGEPRKIIINDPSKNNDEIDRDGRDSR